MENIGNVYEFHPMFMDQLVEDLKEAGFDLKKSENGMYHFLVPQDVPYSGGIEGNLVITRTGTLKGLDDFLRNWTPPSD